MAGRATRHPHLVAVTVAVGLFVCLVLGPWLWGLAHADPAEGRWELRAGQHGVPAGLVIEIEDGQVTGEGPCNSFSARWSRDTGASDLLSTAIGCANDVIRAEETYHRLLSADMVEADDELRLGSAGPDLVFARVDER